MCTDERNYIFCVRIVFFVLLVGIPTNDSTTDQNTSQQETTTPQTTPATAQDVDDTTSEIDKSINEIEKDDFNDSELSDTTLNL